MSAIVERLRAAISVFAHDSRALPAPEPYKVVHELLDALAAEIDRLTRIAAAYDEAKVLADRAHAEEVDRLTRERDQARGQRDQAQFEREFFMAELDAVKGKPS